MDAPTTGQEFPARCSICGRELLPQLPWDTCSDECREAVIRKLRSAYRVALQGIRVPAVTPVERQALH
jgi:hypothetical protein